MAYSLQKTASLTCDPTAKNRVWDFFDEPTKPRPANRPRTQQPRRKNRPCSYKTASGRPYWPSRDPIGERGGVNLYGFVKNAAPNRWDFLGKITLFDDIGGNGGTGLIFPPAIEEDNTDEHFPEDPNFKYLGNCNYRCTLIGDGKGSTCPYNCKRTGGSAADYCPPTLDSSNTKNPLTSDQCEGECEKSFTYNEEVFGHPDNKWPNNSNN